MLQLYIDLSSSRLACRDIQRIQRIQRIQLYSYTRYTAYSPIQPPSGSPLQLEPAIPDLGSRILPGLRRFRCQGQLHARYTPVWRGWILDLGA